MRASEFARRRAKIEQRSRGRGDFKRKAMRHLVAEAGAREVFVAGRLVGWALSTGGVVCVKQRFRDWMEAQLALQRIAPQSRPVLPVRAYACPFCQGFHLTSQGK